MDNFDIINNHLLLKEVGVITTSHPRNYTSLWFPPYEIQPLHLEI